MPSDRQGWLVTSLRAGWWCARALKISQGVLVAEACSYPCPFHRKRKHLVSLLAPLVPKVPPSWFGKGRSSGTWTQQPGILCRDDTCVLSRENNLHTLLPSGHPLGCLSVCLSWLRWLPAFLCPGTGWTTRKASPSWVRQAFPGQKSCGQGAAAQMCTLDSVAGWSWAWPWTDGQMEPLRPRVCRSSQELC